MDASLDPVRLKAATPASTSAPSGGTGGALSPLGRLYVGCSALLGMAAVAQAAHQLYVAPLPQDWFIWAALTLLSGSFTLKIPSIPARISISEVFVFSCVVLFGTAPATITVALDGLIISCRRKHRWHRVLFNCAEPAISVWVASELFFGLAGVPPLSQYPTDVRDLLVPLAVLASVYFLLNSSLTALAVGLETHRSAISLWRMEFLPLVPNYLAGASLAAVLVITTRQVSFGGIAVILPLLAICYLLFKTSMGRVEDAARHLAEQKSLEEQFRQAQKMEAIGRLAAGLAHDFNNLLTVIHGHSDLLLLALDPSDERRSDVEEIRKAAQRAARLTRQLLVFSRKQVLQPTAVDLNDMVVSIEKMLRHVIGEDIEFVIRPAPTLGTVQADRGQIEQVILNLAVNARDAMPRGGKLTIETANVDLDEAPGEAQRSPIRGPYVVLAVSDTGCGMDAGTKSHLFEPFFTTKEPGKGTGLGLATVYGIINQSGGHIRVSSEPDQGTTFNIYLPRVDRKPLQPGQPSRSIVAFVNRSETILLVEDDQAVRALARKVLQRQGYHILDAETPASAIQLADQYLGPIHLLLTDVVMPGMNGPELAKRLAPGRPQMKVLFTSGHTDDEVLHEVSKPGKAFLQKPFTPERLQREVREVLDGPSGQSVHEAGLICRPPSR